MNETTMNSENRTTCRQRTTRQFGNDRRLQCHSNIELEVINMRSVLPMALGRSFKTFMS